MHHIILLSIQFNIIEMKCWERSSSQHPGAHSILIDPVHYFCFHIERRFNVSLMPPHIGARRSRAPTSYGMEAKSAYKGNKFTKGNINCNIAMACVLVIYWFRCYIWYYNMGHKSTSRMLECQLNQ